MWWWRVHLYSHRYFSFLKIKRACLTHLNNKLGYVIRLQYLKSVLQEYSSKCQHIFQYRFPYSGITLLLQQYCTINSNTFHVIFCQFKWLENFAIISRLSNVFETSKWIPKQEDQGKVIHIARITDLIARDIVFYCPCNSALFLLQKLSAIFYNCVNQLKKTFEEQVGHTLEWSFMNCVTV